MKFIYICIILFVSYSILYSENVKLLYDLTPDDFVDVIKIDKKIFVFTNNQNSKIKITLIENGQKKEIYNLVRKIIDSTYYFDDGTRDYNNFYTDVSYINSKFYITSWEQNGLLIIDTLGNLLSKNSIGKNEFYNLKVKFIKNNKTYCTRNQEEISIYFNEKKIKSYKPSDYGLVDNDSLYYSFINLIDLEKSFLIIGYVYNKKTSLKKQFDIPFVIIADTVNLGKRDFYYTKSDTVTAFIDFLTRINNTFISTNNWSDPATFEKISPNFISYDTLRTLHKLNKGSNKDYSFWTWGILKINDSTLINYGSSGNFFISTNYGLNWSEYDSLQGKNINSYSTIHKAFLFEDKILLAINIFYDTKIVELLLNSGTKVEFLPDNKNISFVSENVLYFKEEISSFEILDIKGNTIAKIDSPNSFFDLRNLNSGIYFVTYKRDNKFCIEKIMFSK